jgi:hypothetical protein
LRGAKVLPQIRFTVGEWRTDRHAILDRIATARWGGGRLIVRSTARSEDLLGRSSAGKYASVLDVVGAQRTEAQQRAVHVKSWLGEAFRYTLARRTALMRFLDDGIVEIDNRPAAWAIRGMRWTAPSWALAGGDAAAALYTVVQSAVLTGLDPRTYLREVLRRLAADVEVDSQIGTLLPWAFASPTMPAG